MYFQQSEKNMGLLIYLLFRLELTNLGYFKILLKLNKNFLIIKLFFRWMMEPQHVGKYKFSNFIHLLKEFIN